MTNDKIEKIENVLNKVLAHLFPPPEDEEVRINSARVTANRLKAFGRTKQNAQFELPQETYPANNTSQSTAKNQGNNLR